MRIQLTKFLIILLVASCFISCEKDDNENENSDNFIFIHQITLADGEHISGPLNQYQLTEIDFPTYDYDLETKSLYGVIDFEINKDLKLIYGSGLCNSGLVGGGCGTGLSGIYEIPFEREGFELIKVNSDARIIAIYNDDVINLDVGEEWTKEVVRMDTVEIDGELCIDKYTTTSTIINLGEFKKSDILSWEW